MNNARDKIPKKAVKKVSSKATSKTGARRVKQDTAAERKKEVEKQATTEYDTDWGLDDFNKYDEEEGNYIYDFEDQQQAIMLKVASATEMRENHEQSLQKLQKWEDVIVGGLIAMNSADNVLGFEELDKALTQFQNSWKTIPRVLINKSKLLRVLILNQRTPDFVDDNYLGEDAQKARSLQEKKKYRERIRVLLSKLGLEVRQNTRTELDLKQSVESGESKLATPEIESVKQESIEPVAAAAAGDAAMVEITNANDIKDEAYKPSPLSIEIG